MDVRVCTMCLICDKYVETDPFTHAPKICDECREAVLHIKKQLKKQKEENHV